MSFTAVSEDAAPAPVGRPAVAGLLRVGPPGRGPAVAARAGPRGNLSWTAGTTSCAVCATPPSPWHKLAGGLVWSLQAPDAAGPRPEDAAGGTGLPALAGRQPGLKPAGPPGPGQQSRSCPTKLFSTKVKQCHQQGPRSVPLPCLETH